VIGFTQIRQNRIRNRSDIVVVGLSPCHRAFSPKTFSNIGTNLRGVIVATAGDAAPALDARRWIDARAAAHMRKLYLLPVTAIKIRSECGSQILLVLLERGEGRLQGYGDSQFSPSIRDSVKERVVLYNN
jgi:hypothetical protein